MYGTALGGDGSCECCPERCPHIHHPTQAWIAESAFSAVCKEKRELEAKVKNLERCVSDPDFMMSQARLCGVPVDDLKTIFKVLGDWGRAGGRPALVEEYKRFYELEAENKILRRLVLDFKRDVADCLKRDIE
jgi:hypothetical protein